MFRACRNVNRSIAGLHLRNTNTDLKKDTLITEEFRLKGMICSRCMKVLGIELKATGAKVNDMELGRVVVQYDPIKIERSAIARIIRQNDFEIVVDKETLLAEQTKRWIINFVWSTDLGINLSDYLADKLGISYQKLSKNFSKVVGKTLERYAASVKVERIKECLDLDQLTASEIAFSLGYQNVSALSRQFKKETGMTLTEYRSSGNRARIPLNMI